MTTGRWWLGWRLPARNGDQYSPTAPQQVIGMLVPIPIGRACTGIIVDVQVINGGEALFLTAEVIEAME